jgi:LPXTG-site transpeptidase (sortase) family protein
MTAALPRWEVIKCIRGILLACSVSLLAYCGYVLIDSWVFQQAERNHLNQLLTARRQAPGIRANLTAPSPAIVMEGAGKTILRRAAGHIPGTALPGEVGNIGISAHRDTYFRPLRNIERNDIITLTTAVAEYRYRVLSTKVVSPYDLAVLNPTADQSLTLVTCYPFYFVGAAPSRFIVRAKRVVTGE